MPTKTHMDKDFPAPIDFTDYEDGEDQEESIDVVPPFVHDNLTIQRPSLDEIIGLTLGERVEGGFVDFRPMMATTAPNVPFPRALIPGMTGWDVRGHKRAWSRAFPDLYPWPDKGGFTDYFGPAFKEAVIKGQKRTGILATGKIGSATHEMLERRHRHEHPNEWAFDALAIELCKDYAREYAKTPEQKVREAIIAAWEFWCTLNSSISYSQERPFALVKPPQYSSRMDCSEYYTLGCFAAGARDPNGYGYNGYGYTGSIMANTARCQITDLEDGDPIFYGFSSSRPGFPSGSPTHIAGYGGIQYSPERGRSVRVLYTMGSSSDPRKRPLDYRHDVNHYAKHRVV